jgi:hypothetical protein
VSELPDFLEGGEVARLIPVGAVNQRERVACSVLLAALRVVQPFARSFFAGMNWRSGNWAQVHGYTEPVFKSQQDGLRRRPDGLLILNTGRREGRFIVEAKIGGAKIDTDQLAEYSQLVRPNGIDAIIPVSNELSSGPADLPYALPREVRNLTFYHWSWSHLVMLAELVLREEEDFDEEQDYILREIIRYFDHESVGVVRGSQMCSDWSDIVERIQVGGHLKVDDPTVQNVIQCWHQQLAGLCISQSRHLRQSVTLRLARSQWDPKTRLVEDLQEFVEDNRLLASFVFPTEVGPIEVAADARRRSITCSLGITAPLNRQRYGARVRWLLNQLPDEISLPLRVNLIWERGQRSEAALSSLRDDLNAARLDSPGGPRSFEIISVTDLAGRFAGSRTFIASLEQALSEFHENIARHLRPWRAPTSQPVQDDEIRAEEPIEHSGDNGQSAGVLQHSGDDQSVDISTRSSSHNGQSAKKERKVAQSGMFAGKSFSIFDDGSIEIETGSGRQQFKNFAELQAAAEVKNGHAGLK